MKPTNPICRSLLAGDGSTGTATGRGPRKPPARRLLPIGCVASAFFFTIVGAAQAPIVDRGDLPKPPHPLVWDAMEKTLDARPKDGGIAEFEFTATNRSDKPVEIVELRPSCGCTTTEMPARPWILAPGARGSFKAQADFRGKSGKFTKTVYVMSDPGSQMLILNVNIIETEEERRQRNQQMALADRQAVFRGECAACHVEPTVGKTGEGLFQTACGICHLAPHRASMVPDLMVASAPRDEAYWRQWIAQGREGSLMPAFANRHGGPLTDPQIDSLIEYALKTLPTQPRAQ